LQQEKFDTCYDILDAAATALFGESISQYNLSTPQNEKKNSMVSTALNEYLNLLFNHKVLKMITRPTKCRDRAQPFHLGLMKSDNDLNADGRKQRNDFYDRYSGYKSRFYKKFTCDYLEVDSKNRGKRRLGWDDSLAVIICRPYK